MSTVRDLLEELGITADDDYSGELTIEDPSILDCEVRTATQPSWPFEHQFGGIQVHDLGALDEDELEDARRAAVEGNEEARAFLEEQEARQPERVVWLMEGGHIGYLPGAVAKAAGWGR